MTQKPKVYSLSRRRFVSAGLAGAFAGLARGADGQAGRGQKKPIAKTYARQVSGVRIYPGMWRPHYRWEHIAWVSPPWAGQDYIWLDFPEAIFTKQGLLYLSHINPRYPVVFPNPSAVKWQRLPEGICYERTLPNGVSFGGKVTKTNMGADLELFIRNGSKAPLEDIKLQTCAFLRACKEFSRYTADNKYVHVPDRGWLAYQQAVKVKKESGKYRLGWRSGKAISDMPIMVTQSSSGKRLAAFTWLTDTYSLVTNPTHPCMHADPYFSDLVPGQSSSIRGRLFFFEGSPDDFGKSWQGNLL
ncbi:MAG: hypothetical protein ACYTBZ_14905 [Planctomycetota bacterium]